MVTSVKEDTEKLGIKDDAIRSNVLALRDLIDRYLGNDYIQSKLSMTKHNVEATGQKMKLEYRNKDIQAINGVLQDVVSTSSNLDEQQRTRVRESILDKGYIDVDIHDEKDETDHDENGNDQSRLINLG